MGESSLGGSKTNRMIAFGIGLSLVLVMIGIAVEVLFDKSVETYVALGLGKVGIDTGLAVHRNIKTDTPERLQEAAVTQAIRAKNAGVELPPMIGTQAAEQVGLREWKPKEESKT